jgi:hypothetical protein
MYHFKLAGKISERLLMREPSAARKTHRERQLRRHVDAVEWSLADK